MACGQNPSLRSGGGAWTGAELSRLPSRTVQSGLRARPVSLLIGISVLHAGRLTVLRPRPDGPSRLGRTVV